MITFARAELVKALRNPNKRTIIESNTQHSNSYETFTFTVHFLTLYYGEYGAPVLRHLSKYFGTMIIINDEAYKKIPVLPVAVSP